MATPRAQRIGIWIITVVMAIGAVGVYFVAILANNNDSNQQQRRQQVVAEYQQKTQAQAKQLSEKYFATFSGYEAQVRSFDAAAAQEKLVVEDLKPGDGDVIGDDTPFAAYYILSNADGKILQQSVASGALQEPLRVDAGLQKATLIDGWKQGLKGMKIGGVRQLTVPSALAYKEAGQGADIPPNTPLRFVVMAVPLPAEIPVPPELMTGY